MVRARVITQSTWNRCQALTLNLVVTLTLAVTLTLRLGGRSKPNMLSSCHVTSHDQWQGFVVGHCVVMVIACLGRWRPALSSVQIHHSHPLQPHLPHPPHGRQGAVTDPRGRAKSDVYGCLLTAATFRLGDDIHPITTTDDIERNKFDSLTYDEQVNILSTWWNIHKYLAHLLTYLLTLFIFIGV